MGKSRSLKISSSQIRMGTMHEMEHTKNPRFAKKIALDHLREHPTYYTALNRMERNLEKKGK